MTIRKMGDRLREAMGMESDTFVPNPTAPTEDIAWPYGPGPTREAAEAEAVRAAEAAAETARRFLQTAPPGAGGVAEAHATLALAASVDALREAITDRLDLIADVLSQPKD